MAKVQDLHVSPDFVDIPHTDHVASPTPTSVWAEKAEKCLLDCFRDLSTVTVKNRWLKISQKMGGFGFNLHQSSVALKSSLLKRDMLDCQKRGGNQVKVLQRQIT